MACAGQMSAYGSARNRVRARFQPDWLKIWQASVVQFTQPSLKHQNRPQFDGPVPNAGKVLGP